MPFSHPARAHHRRRTGRALAVALGLVSVTAGACSDSGDEPSVASSRDSTSSVPESANASVARSASESVATTGSSTTTSTIASTTSTTVIPTVPESGVPGIESGDDFCRAWSEFAGSFQALALASSLATDPGAARRAEVAAASAVVAAVGEMDDDLPAELESERDVLLTDLVGPFGRRAQRAVDELDAAGVPPGGIDALGDLWLAALVEQGLDDPDLSVAVPAGLEPAFAEAVAVFAAEVPPIAQDPSLVTAANAPLTEGYLSANCPDQGTLAGNDVVDG